ncbi:MAG TPA: class I and II aminotransferase [Cyanobacteria bacterium UBA11149]|nr:class I and II aminotransferase [Cyanobacteria bacterium UBA11367]HBE57944.1 class I and II aminotransferase [Cyanobacteria bacterium UBA11366]HBK62867.1 class I and II aminotransferase [Cyanobacteria bacterium UBA11166]HBR76017.1 class I and II aminotransferase [Cyanobacteria bacterium UBA11159]HBS71029.1 class I and II aminotransferase [Cyanobacteria bacterium UBA11153]HBW90873.1 class I and II aminotransferase [Cyanobacteria bacterium UBA11149]HCA96206.1 class I and II aminotransferase 
MKAIILAAGSGQRMRPLSLATHKTLLKIGDRTILDRLVDQLVANQVTHITIVTGYRAEEVEKHLIAHHPAIDFHFIHNHRYGETNNICSLALAMEKVEIDDDIILIESDLVVESSVFTRLFTSPHPNIALLDRYRTGMDGTVVTVVDGIVTNVIPPHLQGSDFNFADKYKTLNIYKFSQEFCQGTFKNLLTYYAKVIDSQCYYEVILGIIITMQREVIHAEILEGYNWAELDDPNDFDSANYIFDSANRYSLVQKSHGSYWNYDLLDFCYIRNMYFPTGAVISELRNGLPALIQNYGSCQEILNQKLAYYLLCREENVTVLNGAAQIYPILAHFFAGQRILLPSPTFGEYSRIFPQAEYYFDEVGINGHKLLNRIDSYDVIVFVNPNNPTGTTLISDWIFGLAEANPDKFIIVDESFIDFSNQPSLVSFLEQDPLPNIILIKSLSKTLGIPGIRLGYTYTCNREFNKFLRENIPIWNLNSIAEHFLEIILKHRQAIAKSFDQTAQDRDRFATMLESLPIVEKVFPSGGNFLLTKLRLNRPQANALAEKLLVQQSIYVKDVSSRFHGDGAFFRLAVRKKADCDRLIASIADIARD